MAISYPKPTPKKIETPRAKRTAKAERAIFRLAIVRRDGHCCRCCGRAVFADGHEFLLGHVHELTPRSLGGSATDAKNCVTLCMPCHSLVHAKTIWLEADTASGAEGRVSVHATHPDQS